MEKWQVVGWRDVDFKDQQTGRQVSGTSLFLVRTPEDPKVVGLEVSKIFLAKGYVDYTPIKDQKIGINFNRYGKVQSIEPLG